MKINQWTMGLAAVGVVSLASAVQAEESMNAVQTALSGTTISGYVDTSLEWDNGDDYAQFGPSIPFRNAGSIGDKTDGFNLNVVKLSLEKAMDESEWAAGYKVDLLVGPDAVNYNSSVNGNNTSDFGIKQAYVALRTPVGNGIDWKMGVFDTIIGYEVFDSGHNPNFTRSYAWSAEPTQHTGLLGTYRISDTIAVAGGIANTEYAGINARDNNASDKTWLGSVAVTAPDDMGFLSGSTLYAGAVLGSGKDNAPVGPGAADAGAQDNYYVGATLNTPVTGLKAGVAFDQVQEVGGGPGDAWSIALYASFQATEKLSLHGRAEKVDLNNGGDDIYGLTATAQYDLWANVISRAEVRYDDERGAGNEDAFGAFLNVIYVF
jgi:hypothetical protein